MRTQPLVLSLTFLAALAAARAAEPTKEQLDFFEKKVRPILSEKCYKCHSIESGKSKGGLTLDTRAATLKGGDSGPAVTPGDLANSLLITAVSYKDKDLQMPPDKDNNKKLSDPEIADLTEWVKMGAPDPRTEVAKTKKLTGLYRRSAQPLGISADQEAGGSRGEVSRLVRDPGGCLHRAEAGGEEHDPLASPRTRKRCCAARPMI